MRAVSAMFLRGISLGIALVSPSAFGAITEAEYGELSDVLGSVYAWRMIPAKILERCETEAPESTSAREVVYEQWKNSNQNLILLIDRAVRSAVPIYAELLQESQEEAQGKIDDIVASLIQKNYFGDPRFGPAIICADYSAIESGLSKPGNAAAMRGRVYQIEMLLRKLKKSQLEAEKPDDPLGAGVTHHSTPR